MTIRFNLTTYAAVLVALLTTFNPAFAQEFRIIREGTDATNIAPGRYIGSWHDDTGVTTVVEGRLDREVNPLGEADIYEGDTEPSTTAVLNTAVSIGEESRWTQLFTFDDLKCFQSDPTARSIRPIGYVVTNLGAKVSFGVANHRSECVDGPLRIEVLNSYPDPTFDYELRVMPARPVPIRVQLGGVEPHCNSDLDVINSDLDIIGYKYDANTMRRNGFCRDFPNGVPPWFTAKVLAHHPQTLVVLDEQGNLLFHSKWDCEDPLVEEGSCATGPALLAQALEDAGPGRYCFWWGVLESEADPREADDPTCLIRKSSASQVRNGPSLMLFNLGDAELVLPSTEVNGNQVTITVIVESSIQMGSVEVFGTNGSATVVDTVHVVTAANAADRWRTTTAYTVSVILQVPEMGDWSFTVTPLLRGPYADYGTRRNDLAVTSDAIPVANEGNTPGVPTQLTLSAFPNPLVGQGKVIIEMSTAQHVRVALYDILGREVIVLTDERLAPGRRELQLDTSTLAPGTYVLRASGTDVVATQRITVIR